MDIFAIFRDNQFFQGAIVQGRDFDERGDDRWKERIRTYNHVFHHNDDDWIQISEDDFKKYMLGDHMRDPSSNSAIPNPAFVKSPSALANQISRKYQSQINDLVNAISLADLQGDDSYKSELRAEYSSLIQHMKHELKGVNNDEM